MPIQKENNFQILRKVKLTLSVNVNIQVSFTINVGVTKNIEGVGKKLFTFMNSA